ncbi:aspartyl protease family protein [Gracilimonas sp.]|uniref:aspartyl protease family protein n=1 Tax=Gracilimonas sp. TaxID=1974203 RepID=UPI002871C7A7|nr:aspartyl protease family protein [Gracilimonas sp.]
MKGLKAVGLLIGIILTAELYEVQAQHLESKFRIPENPDKRVTVPFELINNLIVIEIRINGSEPLKFILDSGAGRNIITTLYDETIELKNLMTVRLAGLGTGNSLEAFHSYDNEMKIGDRIIGEEIEILILKEDLLHLSSYMGTEIHGIFGYTFFESFAVEINYSRELLRIYDTKEFENKFKKLPKNWRWHKLPISVEDKKPHLNIHYKHSQSSDYKSLKFLVDSGASNSFSLYEMTDENIKVPSKTVNSIIGTGLSGLLIGEIGKVQKMKMGEFESNEPIVSFPDSQSVRRALQINDRKGSVGGDILRRFKVIFHYENEMLYLRKNWNFGDDFYFNASGLEVSAPIPDIPYYVVSYVREDSPAANNGIKEGDVILKVNGQNSARLTMNDMLDYFQKKRGDQLFIEVQRDSLKKSFRIDMDINLVPDR